MCEVGWFRVRSCGDKDGTTVEVTLGNDDDHMDEDGYHCIILTTKPNRRISI